MESTLPTLEQRLASQGTERQRYYFGTYVLAAREGEWQGLRQLQAAVWSHMADGLLTDDQAGYVTEVIDARRKPAERPNAKPPRSPESYVGTRPIGPTSLDRRRRLSREAFVHPQDTGDLTNGEMAVLTIVTEEIIKAGRCLLPVGKLAALAGISRRWAQHALRKLAALDFLAVEHRPGTARRHDTNVVTLHPSRTSLASRLKAVKRWWRGRGGLPGIGRSLAHTTRLKRSERHPRSGDNSVSRAPAAPRGSPGGWTARPAPS